MESAKAGQPAGSHFGYGGVITEMALMGVVASTQRGKILEYDTKAGRFKNNDEANKLIFVKGSYRDGWALPV